MIDYKNLIAEKDNWISFNRNSLFFYLVTWEKIFFKIFK